MPRPAVWRVLKACCQKRLPSACAPSIIALPVAVLLLVDLILVLAFFLAGHTDLAEGEGRGAVGGALRFAGLGRTGLAGLPRCRRPRPARGRGARAGTPPT